jgi:hypothetical protein
MGKERREEGKRLEKKGIMKPAPGERKKRLQSRLKFPLQNLG